MDFLNDEVAIAGQIEGICRRVAGGLNGNEYRDGVVAGRCAATVAVVFAMLELVGCSPGPTGANRHGPARLTVVGKDVGCCYVEGSRHFAQDLNGPREVGSVTFEIDPGDYVATFWQRPCDGSCRNLDAVSSHCRVTFAAQAGTSIRIDVTFPLRDQCVAVVS